MRIVRNRKLGKRSHSPDILILWEWEFDDDFIFYISAAARHRNLKVLTLHPANWDTFFELCNQDDFLPAMVIDRASDVHAQLLPCLTTLKHRGAFFINDPDRMAWCRDKATMHLELVSEGVMVPYGIIISRFDLPEQVFPFAAEKLGVPFVIKPSEGGGGEGVVLNASEVQDIRRALETSRTGKVVLQKKITPQMINHRRAWFRVFYLLGRIIPCWWDDLTHLYQPLIADDLDSDLIETVERVMKDIAKTCQLAFFSSEFALDQSNQLQVIDFVNEMCDMRMRSRHMDGVPDDIVFKIIRDISAFCKGLIHAKTTRAGT